MLGKRRHRLLLPIDRQIMTALGLSEAQYREFQAEQERMSRLRPVEGPVALDPLTGFLINLAISAVLSAAAYLLTPRPRLKQRNAPRPGELRQEQQQGQQLVSRTEFAPKQGISSTQDTVELGATIPVVWAHRETINGVTYGGVRVNCPLLWSQMVSLGGSQMLRAVYLVGEASITGIDPQQFAFGENLLSAYDLGAAGESSARVTIYHRPGGGRIRATDRIAGRLAANDPGNAEAAGAADVYQVRGLNNEYVPATCYSYQPSSQTTFGVYAPIGNGLAYRVNPQIRPITQANLKTPRDQKLVEQGISIIVCSRDNAATAQREKSDAISASRCGLTAHRRGGSSVTDNTLLVDDEVDLVIDAGTDAGGVFTSGDYSEGKGDIGSAVAGRQRAWDDAIVVGELYRIGSAVCVCSSRSPSDDVFRSDVDQQPIGGGISVTATFRVVEAGTGDFPGTGGTRSGTAAPHVLRMARATVAIPQPAQVIELGIRSTVGIRVAGLMNFRDAMPYAEVDGRACDYYNLSYLLAQQILRVTQYQSGTITQTETRFSFWRLRYRIAASGSAWSSLPQLFGVSGSTQQAQYNFLRIEFPTRQRWEVRLDPVSGWEVRSGTASGDLIVIDARLSSLQTVGDGSVVVRVAGDYVQRQASTFTMPCTINTRGGIGMPNVDGGNYVDEWARLAEQFVYDEITTSASSPEHEITYVNVIDTAPTTPTYPDMTLVGVNIRSGTEAQQLGQLSVYVNDGPGASHSFPALLAAGLLDQRYGVGSILSPLQVDEASFAAASDWTRTRGYFWDGALPKPVNIRTWGNDTAALFLLDLITRNGVSYLQPAVLFGAPEQITGLFNAGNIVPGSFKLSYLDQTERQPVRVSVKWREERRAEGDGSNRGLFPVTREVTVREIGVSETAPLEVIDMSDFCTSERHAIDVAKLKCRMKRLVTHQVTFETIPQQATLSPGRCCRLAMETVAYETARNGAILADGTIVSSEPIADGTYDALLWNGSSQTQEVGLVILGGRAVNQGQVVFCLAERNATEMTYKVQSMAFNDAGNIAVTALHWPTDDDGLSLISDGFDVAQNWVIEGAIGSTDAPGTITASFTGVTITGPSTLTVNVAGSYAAVVSGTGTGFTYSWTGAGLTFGTPTAAATTITATSSGSKTASCAVTRGGVTITDTHPILAVAAPTSTTIGTVTITGSTTGTSPATITSTAGISGTATDLVYSWTAPVIPAGGTVDWISTSTASATATFTGVGTYQLACRVTSYVATDRIVDKAVTFNLSTDTATATAHGFAAGDQVTFTATSGDLPTGLLQQTTYWVRSGGLTADEFTVASEPGGALLALSGTASGSYRVTRLGKSDLQQVVIS
jgi:hypothetical protein